MRLFTRLTGLIALSTLLSAVPGLAQTQVTPPAQNASSNSWHQLGAKERQALAPLAARWGEISEGQRSKWRTIAKNFDQLSDADRQLMQTRMKEWAALSPVQRNQARLNFNTVQSVSKDQKKNRWDEYQALSDEEKRKLLNKAPAPAKTTAPSAKPTTPARLIQPAGRAVPANALPAQVPINPKTLLPLPATPPGEASDRHAPASDPAATKETPAS
jgi:hypothetical protein